MRVVFFLALLVTLALVGYIGITGYFLAHGVAGLGRGGIISQANALLPPDDPLEIGYRGDPKRALSLPFEAVAIETALGPAEAWFVPGKGTEKGRAIYVHGISGAREDGYRHVSILHEAGWSVLLVSYRNAPGAPSTPDDIFTFGLTEWPDLEAAIAFLVPTDDVPGLLILADATGAAILGQFLAQSDIAGRVRAIALDSPTLGMDAMIDHAAAQSERPLYQITALAARMILPQMTGFQPGQTDVAQTYQTFPGPLFVAHGTGDRTVPVGPSEALAAAREGVVALWTKADHLGSFAEDPKAYSTAFNEFLAKLAP
jgi:uncharacterized protein